MNIFKPNNSKLTNNKSGQSLISLILIMAIIIGLVIFGIVSMNNPKFIFQKEIDKIFNMSKSKDFKTVKAQLDLDIEVEGQDKIAEFINEANLSIGIENSQKSKVQIATLKLSNEEDELINAKMKLDSEAEKVYFDLGEFFDKTLEVDVSETLKDSEDLESSSLTLGQLISAKKASSILEKEIKEQLIEDNMITEKVNINDEKLTKNTLKVTGKELAQMSANICKNLMENNKFTECFENPEQTKKYLENVVKTFEKGQFSEKFEVEISVYTKGIFKTVKRIDIEMSENNENTSYILTKVNKEEFVLEIEKDDENVFSCDVKIKEKKDVYNIELSFEQYEEKTVIKMEISYTYDEELTEVDTSNCVNVEKMTEKDSMKIYNNLANSKFYKIIEDISNSFYDTTSSGYYDYY